MVISIFTPPEEDKDWNECKTGDICDCLTFEYEKYFNGAGTFTLELPITTRFRDMVVVGSVLVTSDGDALIVKNIQTTLDKVKVTGYDLNGLLTDRITMPTDEDGTDPVEGSTEYCVKHYVSFNLEACDKDENRNLPRFAVAENQDRGLPADHNMPRLQNLHDVVTEMCGAAKLGWRVSIDSAGASGSGNPVFVFDVAEQVDRSVNQSDRNRVIFSVQQHNVSEMTREVGVTAAKNALYLDINGTVVGYPQAKDGSGREVASGYSRREEYCALAGESLDFEKYSVEAEQNIADRMEETDSLTIEAGNPLDYRVKYDVGDIVTVYDRERSLQLDSVISAVTVRRSGTEYSVKLTLGESKPKLLDQYAKKGEVVGKVVRNDVPKISAGGLIPLTEYEYITDLSAKLNGVTYTVEKDADTGLIAKISDSNGNSFEPTVNSGITDTALHNAVFWAVAMTMGFGGSSAPKPVIELLFNNSLENTGSGNYTIAPNTDSPEILYSDGLNGKCYAATNKSSITITGVSELLLSDFTITFWTKINNNGLSPYPQYRRFVWWTANNAYRGCELKDANGYSTNIPGFVVTGGVNAGTASTPIADGEWHSVSITQRGSTITTTIDQMEQIVWNNCILSPVRNYLALSHKDYTLNGYISSFRVFNKALSYAEIERVLALK